MIGRGGRAGQPSTSLLFYSAAEMKGTTNSTLTSVFDQKENCRRRTLLKALGSSESVTVNSGLCCDVCEPVCPYKELEFSFVSVVSRKRTVRKRALPPTTQQSMEAELLAQRDALIEKNPALKIFPKSIVCPLSVIKEVCLRSRSIKSVHDFQSIPCVRQEFYSPFFYVIVECLGSGYHSKHTCISQQSLFFIHF